MPYSYSFDPIVAIEYENTYKWYQERSVTAADNLVISLEETVKNICTQPYRYRNTHKNLRELSLKNIPLH